MAKMTVAHETVTLPNGVRYEAKPVATPQEAMRATIHITLNHMAEVMLVMMKAVSERYGIDQEEMMNVVAAHPEYTAMLETPVLKDLGYDLQVEEPAAAAAVATPVPAATPIAEPKKRGRPKGSKNKTPRKEAAAATAAPEPAAVAADTASVVSAGSLIPGKRYTIAELKAHLKAKKAAAATASTVSAATE